jgi:AsmA protein
VFSLEEYGLHGIIETDLVMRGSKKDAEAGRYDQLYNKGTLRVKDIELHAPGFPKPFEVREGAFHFEQDDMLFDRFKAAYGSSDLELHGRLEHMISYITRSELPLEGRFQLTSNRIVVDEFTAYAPPKPANGTTVKNTGPGGVVVIPENVDLALEATVAKVRYQGLEMNDFKGQVSLDSGRMNLRDVHFGVMGTSVSMDGAYESVSPTKAIFDYRVDARDFDVKKAYQEVDLFHDLVPSAANAEGIVSLNYHLAGKLNASMDPVMPSLKGEGVLSLKKVKLKGFKMMNSLSNTTGRDAIKDPDLSKVDIHSHIANNIMTIERFKMKIAGFRPRFEGQIGLDGRLNLKGRLGLPPFGIFGIPFTVTGTQKDPKVGVRRSRNSDQLEETKEEAEED